MMGIVFEHAVNMGTGMFNNYSSTKSIVYLCLIQLGKFGTISFFILAGFLLGSSISKYTPVEYFKRRLANTVMPWMFWSLIFLVALVWKSYLIVGDSQSLAYLIKEGIKLVYFYSNYWFIINFMICIGILLCFNKYLYSPWLGVLSGLSTLVYSINIYYHWFQPRHTMAILGFVFFLWLGVQLNKKWEAVKGLIDRIPNLVFAVIFLISFAAAVLEIENLYRKQSVDPFNTLRFSNVLFSLICVFILLKVNTLNFTKYLKPRQTTFGIYLIHYILVFNFLPELMKPFHIPDYQYLSTFSIVLLSIARFVVVYLLTFMLVSFIGKSRLKAVIGC